MFKASSIQRFRSKSGMTKFSLKWYINRSLWIYSRSLKFKAIQFQRFRSKSRNDQNSVWNDKSTVHSEFTSRSLKLSKATFNSEIPGASPGMQNSSLKCKSPSLWITSESQTFKSNFTWKSKRTPFSNKYFNGRLENFWCSRKNFYHKS